METKKRNSKGLEIKKYLELKENSNDPNIYNDTYEEEYAEEEIDKIHKSNITRLSGIGYIKMIIPEGSHLSIVHRTDLHYMNSNPELVQIITDYIQDTNTIVIDTGDMLQMPVEGHHDGETQETKINPDEEIIGFDKHAVAPIASKIKSATDGNHDGSQASRLRKIAVNILRLIYKKHNIPYYPEGSIIEVMMPIMQGNKCYGYSSFYVVGLHTRGKISTKKLDYTMKTRDQGMAIVNKFNKLHGTHIIPDLILGGHAHAAADADFVIEADVYDEKGLLVGTEMHTVMVRSGSTTQDMNSSSYNRGFNDVPIPNVTQYDIHLERNRSYDPNQSNKTPRVKPVITEFEVLTTGGELSTKAKEYSEKHPDHSRKFKQQARKQYAKTSPEELLKIIDEKMNNLTK